MTYPAARTLAQSKDITLVILGRAGTCFPIPAVAWHNPLLILLDGQDRVLATRPLLDPDLPQGTNS